MDGFYFSITQKEEKWCKKVWLHIPFRGLHVEMFFVVDGLHVEMLTSYWSISEYDIKKFIKSSLDVATLILFFI